MSDNERVSVEKAVVGCMLIDSRAIDEFTAQGGDPSWFADPTCRTVAGAICQRYADGRVASDLIAVRQAVGSGVSAMWLDECIDDVPTASQAAYYVGLLKGYADKDALEGLQRAIAAQVSRCTPETAQDARGAIESLVNAAMGGGASRETTLAAAGHEWLDRMLAPDSETTLLDWPHRAMTDRFGRIDRQVIWIVALPSVGKTALIIQHLAILAAQGHTVSLASLEMGVDEVAARMMSNIGRLNTSSIAERKATPEEIAKARATASRLSDNVRVCGGAMSIDQIYAWGRNEKRKGSKLLVIDNSRFVTVNGMDNRADRTSYISQRIKQLRDDTQLPVIMLHHTALNESTGREKASWSSDIERDTDLMIFLRHNEKKSLLPKDFKPYGRWCVTADLAKRRNHGSKYVFAEMEFVQHEQRFEWWLDDPTLTTEENDFTSEVLFDNE